MRRGVTLLISNVFMYDQHYALVKGLFYTLKWSFFVSLAWLVLVVSLSSCDNWCLDLLCMVRKDIGISTKGLKIILQQSNRIAKKGHCIYKSEGFRRINTQDPSELHTPT